MELLEICEVGDRSSRMETLHREVIWIPSNLITLGRFGE